MQYLSTVSCMSTYGHVLQRKAMTTSFTDIRRNRRFQSQSVYRTGIDGFLIELSMKELLPTTRYVSVCLVTVFRVILWLLSPSCLSNQMTALSALSSAECRCRRSASACVPWCLWPPTSAASTPMSSVVWHDSCWHDCTVERRLVITLITGQWNLQLRANADQSPAVCGCNWL